MLGCVRGGRNFPPTRFFGNMSIKYIRLPIIYYLIRKTVKKGVSLKKLFNAITDIDNELIEEAKANKGPKFKMKGILTLATAS